MYVLWFLSVRMKKNEFCHIYGCFLGWLCVLVNLFDVFHGCQQQFMSVLWFLSVRIWKTGIFSLLWMFFMVFVSENLKNRNFLTFTSVLWFLSVRIWKTGTFSHLWIIESNGDRVNDTSFMLLLLLEANVMSFQETVRSHVTDDVMIDWFDTKGINLLFLKRIVSERMSINVFGVLPRELFPSECFDLSNEEIDSRKGFIVIWNVSAQRCQTKGTRWNYV
jgi:hypothetical protein